MDRTPGLPACTQRHQVCIIIESMVASLLIWAWRCFGPLIVLLIIGAAHFALLRVFALDAEIVNKWLAAVLQIIGGILVLWSINDNLGTFRNKGLAQWFIDELRTFTFRKNTTIVPVTGNATFSSAGSANVSFEAAPATIEERLSNIEKGIRELRVFATDLDRKTNARLDLLDSHLNDAMAKQHAAVERLTAQVDRSFVGTFKLQLFGVLLVIYGAVVSAVT